MSSNFNTNQRTREYSYRSQMVDEYPGANLNTMSYEADNGWHEAGLVSPRLSANRRIDTQSIRSSNLNDNKSKDEFTIFGSFTRQKSERKSGLSERTRTVPRQTSTFKNLPVKTQPISDFDSSEYSQIIKKTETVPRLQSQPKYTPQTEISPDSLFDLIQSREAPVSEEMIQQSIAPVRKTQLESAVSTPLSSAQWSQEDSEVPRLKKNVEKMAKKITVLEENNQKLQTHLKNLLDERKQLLRQIESSEFEEIIEEEEVQKAAPKLVERVTPQLVEVSHINCLQKGRITLDDVPQYMLESFRNDIVNQEKVRTEMEKRSLVETLKTQQQKQLRALESEYEAKEMAVQQVSVKSIKKTSVNHIVSEANHTRTIGPSVGVHAFPVAINKQSQYETDNMRTYIAKKNISSWQKSVLDLVLKSVEENNYDRLLTTIFRPSTTIGVGHSLERVAKTTNTETMETSMPIEVIKKTVSQESRAVMAKPILLQRGCQPEDTFKFETGTMTDQIFCRSQGMMTVGDFTDCKSPLNLEPDTVINRSGNRSETRKQTISQTTYVTSPTKDFVNRISKPIINTPETIVEDIVEIKTVKVESIPKPKTRNVVEEIERIVEEKTQQVTSVLDQNKVPKQEIPTTIECWETISHLKDGELIEKTETYHDRLVSTDIEKIKLHMDQHDLSSPTSPSKKVPMNLVTSPKDSRQSSTTNETKTYRRDTTSSNNSAKPVDAKDINISQNFFGSTSSETRTPKKPTIFKELVVHQSVSQPLKKETTIVESKETVISSKTEEPKEIKEEKFQRHISAPLKKEKTIQESEEIITSTNSYKTNLPNSEVRESTYHESEHTMVSSDLKKPSEGKEIKPKPKVPTPIKKETFIRESKQNVISRVSEKAKESNEIKIDQKISKPDVKATTYHESEHIVVNRGINKPTDDKKKEITIRESKQTVVLSGPEKQMEIRKPEVKETSYRESEFTVVNSGLRRPSESKEIKIQHNVSPPLKKESFIRESKQTTEMSVVKESSQQSFSSNIATKPIEIREVKMLQNFSQPSFKETVYHDSADYTAVSSGFKEPLQVREVQQTISVPTRTETIIQESEETIISTSLRKPSEIKEINVQPHLSMSNERSSNYQESEQRFRSGSLTKPSVIADLMIQQNFGMPSLRENSYEESEQRYTYTTTTSGIPGTLSYSSDTVQSNIPTTIGILTSPTSFQSYSSSSSSKGRSNFSTNRAENYSFESDLKFKGAESNRQSVPIQIKSNMSTESIGYNVPINESSTESTYSRSTRIPINITSIIGGPSSIASSNSAFHSLSLDKEMIKSVQSTNEANFETDCSQILLSETIFKYCTQLMIWLKSINIITTSTVDHLPAELVPISSALIDWWVDITTTLDAGQLMATIKYLISTFSKNLLKYLIINLDQQGNTCLHYIVGNQMWDSFSLLESTNLVDPNIYNTQGYTVLMIACTIKINSESSRENLRRLALSANVNLKSKVEGQTAIFIAALHNNSHAIQLLYTLSADINIRDNNDNTPLMIACSNNSIDAVITILSLSGVLVDLKNKDGKTALDIVESAQFSELMEIFSQRRTTKASELSSYSSSIQNSYITRPFVAKKY